MKEYDFRFVIRKAEFTQGARSVHFGGPDTVYLEEQLRMTWPAAKQHLRGAVSAQTKPCHGFIVMARYNDRRPPGWSTYKGVDFDGDIVTVRSE